AARREWTASSIPSCARRLAGLRFHGARVGAKANTEPRPLGESTDAPRCSTPPGVSDIGRLHPRGSEGAFAGRYPGRYHRHHPRAISVPLARPPLFRLPISRHSEGGIRRRRHLLEHIDAAMELAHPAGAEPLAPQPPQLAHFPARLIQRVLTRVSPAGLTRGSIFLRKNAFAKKMDCTATRACPSCAVLCAASRVNPTCGVKPGNDGSG